MTHSKTYGQTNELTKELAAIRHRVEQLNLPIPTYAGIKLEPGKLGMAALGGEYVAQHQTQTAPNAAGRQASQWLQEQARQHNAKFIAAGIVGTDQPGEWSSSLWLEEDIVPLPAPDKDGRQSAQDLAQTARAGFDSSNIVIIPLTDRNEVITQPLVTLNYYQKAAASEDYALLKYFAENFSGKRLAFFSATPQGGGVALMRHALMRLLALLKVDAHWHVLKERAEIFDITKTKFHNVLQAVADPATVLSEQDREIYKNWIAENAALFEPVFQNSDVIVIDDPQPAGLILHIKKINPRVKIIYRSHIQIDAHLADTPGTPQYTTWQFLWQFIRHADLFVSHPIEGFVPQDVLPEKTVLMPATTDLFDGLNKQLNNDQLHYYLSLFDKILLETGQTPLDHARPYIIQVARFDPSKGIPDVLEAYRRLREKFSTHPSAAVPQLVLCGNGSIDDPDGKPMHNLTMEMLAQPPYSGLAEDIKVARLPHIDQLLNALLASAAVALQLSHKEGFEVKVTESLIKGIPVIAYNRGGIPLQIRHNINGFLVKEAGDAEQVANYLFELLSDRPLYKKMSQAAKQHARKDVTTLQNALNWLFLAGELSNKGMVTGDRMYIRQLINRSFPAGQAPLPRLNRQLDVELDD